MGIKRGGYNKRFKGQHSSRQFEDPSVGLSKIVGDACDIYLEKKGIKPLSWSEMKKEQSFKKT